MCVCVLLDNSHAAISYFAAWFKKFEKTDLHYGVLTSGRESEPLENPVKIRDLLP